MTENNQKLGATSKQIRAIFAIAREQGISKERLEKHIEKKYGKESISDLTLQEASELIDCLRQIEQYNEAKDSNGDGIKEVRAKITRLEEKIAILETKMDALVSKVLEDVWLEQGVKIAELEKQILAMRHMLRIYFDKEGEEHEQK